MKRGFVCFFVLFLATLPGWAQKSDIAARLGYPQMIIYNGKIVTMDDSSFESRVGTIVQAMAVRDGKILETGTNASIRSLAGPKTQLINLEGKEVLPGFIITHEHPTDWAFQEPRAMAHVFPNDDIIIHRWMPNLAPEKQLALFDPMMRAAVAKAKPGEWIFFSFNYGPNYEHATAMSQLFAKSIKKAYLDDLAPNNPVKVRNGFITSVVNQKALDVLQSVEPDLSVVLSPSEIKQGFGFSRPMEPDAMFKNRVPLLAKVLKSELEVWASYGAVAIASDPYAYNNLAALRYLDAHGEMPTRFAYSYNGAAWDMETLRYLASDVGMGSPHLWMIGAFAGAGGNCMTIPVSAAWKAHPMKIAGRRSENQCNWSPGSPGYKRLYNAIKAGMRIATVHTSGNKDIANLLNTIQKASADAGMTLDQIRAKRHAFDHTAGAPSPDEIPLIKKLGMMVSVNNNLLWEPPAVVPNMMGTAMVARVYGTEYTNWVAPRNSLVKAHVMTGWETDRPMPQKIFFLILEGMTRYNPLDHKVYGPGERTSRIIQLKSITRWGAYYMLREKEMGTLEPGKFADFIVLDKDFLTVPRKEIPGIHVLMTVVGGKVIHLTRAFGREIGMQPTGPTVWKEKVPKGWVSENEGS